MGLKHVTTVEQLADKKLLSTLMARAAELQAMPLHEYPKPLQDLTICTLFFEPSTRTRLSFETAIQNLGGHLISVENAGTSSSGVKGETLEDTIKTINCYADGIVIRHPEVGSAEEAAKVSDVPIINAGDGAGLHPTQGLLDLYTIQKSKGKIDGLKVAMVGDLLNSRCVHSLVELLALYKIELFLLAPPELKIPESYLKLLKKEGITYHEYEKWEDVIGKVDMLYMTRVQKERFKFIEDYRAIKDSYILTLDLVKQMKKDAIIMSPLPRVNEIEFSIDSDPRAIYFQEVRNGLYARMALLEHIFAN
ncbi:MAG: carbamoyl-phosphate synth [Candidatus Saccharibacteria bacterium]|nr:carbamoyl-phosphate synth [Candidatus Saccharibacteria bacterium]